VRRQAYAPYSHFLVGAALKAEDGSIHVGCNVENAAYPEGICAEANAIGAMIAAGGRRIAELVVVGAGSTPCTPCGGCRQRIREFAEPGTPIRIVDAEGHLLLVRRLDDLLPDSFGPNTLKG
jgi:cytidine deaminase